MDIALCVWDKKGSVEFSGAFNSLYHIRNGELTEFKGDKQPIGAFENASPFTTNQIEVKEGDSLILFSDGFADQFGGPRGKKYKYSSFKELIMRLNGEKIEEWKDQMDAEIEDWMKNEEQIDDICVMTVRF